MRTCSEGHPEICFYSVPKCPVCEWKEASEERDAQIRSLEFLIRDKKAELETLTHDSEQLAAKLIEVEKEASKLVVQVRELEQEARY